MLKKIAILKDVNDGLSFEVDEIQRSFSRAGIETKVFYESDSLMHYTPDCVLVTSPQMAKITPFPTYGLINQAKDSYLELPRFLRNILTYDGYLTFSPRLAEMLRDITFGARKLGSQILHTDFFPAVTELRVPALQATQQRMVIFDPDFTRSRFKNATYHLLDKFDSCDVVTFSIDRVDRHKERFIAVSSIDELDAALQKYGVAICLNSGDHQEGTINPAVIKLFSACVATIAHRTDLLDQYFGENVYYLPGDVYAKALPDIIKSHLSAIAANPQAMQNKVKNAHQVFLKHFAFDNKLADFIKFHETTLISKGYVPNPDPIVEKALPSVTYIMRTGGKHRPFLERALDCLVDQKYPNLHVIFVTHVKVSFINEIIAQYPSIKFKVLESIKSRRSEAIRDGMAAVETDLFGLFDDDDELFPNHVRMLVKTMLYHSNRDWRGEIGMVYSGSVHADDTYPVYERVEFHDHNLVNKNEKRALEHFRFYSAALMSQHAWFMPNGWLARASLIDNELLTDPGLDTCEDLYFELQIAQRRHFAFSVEVTAVHNFHHLGNSTIDDSHKHLPDTQRIALRNFSRTFAPDALYDTGYNIVGRRSNHDLNQIRYQDFLTHDATNEYKNQFYPFRHQQIAGQIIGRAGAESVRGRLSVMSVFYQVIKNIRNVNKVVMMDKYKRKYYFDKFSASIKQYGLFVTICRSAAFLSRQSSNKPGFVYIPDKRQDGVFSKFLLKVAALLKHIAPTRLFRRTR